MDLIGAKIGADHKHRDPSNGWVGDRGYAERAGGLDMYKCVCRCVVLWLGAEFFG